MAKDEGGMVNSKIRDHGPGVCEIEGCGQPRYLFEARNHHAPVCAVHAWERVSKAMADVGLTRKPGPQPPLRWLAKEPR